MKFWEFRRELSLPIVTEAYQRALRRSEKESMEFLETAYNAILNKK